MPARYFTAGMARSYRLSSLVDYFPEKTNPPKGGFLSRDTELNLQAVYYRMCTRRHEKQQRYREHGVGS
jgi:hypothetical protein